MLFILFKYNIGVEKIQIRRKFWRKNRKSGKSHDLLNAFLLKIFSFASYGTFLFEDSVQNGLKCYVWMSLGRERHSYWFLIF